MTLKVLRSSFSKVPINAYKTNLVALLSIVTWKQTKSEGKPVWVQAVMQLKLKRFKVYLVTSLAIFLVYISNSP
jgi:hypothetical protein